MLLDLLYFACWMFIGFLVAIPIRYFDDDPREGDGFCYLVLMLLWPLALAWLIVYIVATFTTPLLDKMIARIDIIIETVKNKDKEDGHTD